MSSKIKGDPFGESDVLVNIQHTLNDVPGVLPTARAMSYFGEHALGWMGLAALGAALGTATALAVDKIGDKVIEPKKAQHNQGGQPSIAERNAQ